MSINCEILDLRAFQAVVELESFHRAADVVYFATGAYPAHPQNWNRPLARHSGKDHATLPRQRWVREVMPLVRRMLEEFDGSLFAMKERCTSARPHHDGLRSNRSVLFSTHRDQNI